MLIIILCVDREWLEGLPALVDSAVFTYLAILPSHNSQPLTSLRQQETQFCVSLIRAKVYTTTCTYVYMYTFNIAEEACTHYVLVHV